MTVKKHFPGESNRLRKGLSAAVLAGGLVLAPLQGALASETGELPNLEGTTYGLMINQLENQVNELDAADVETAALRETTLLLAEHNLLMIHMIDALHDKVNGLLVRDQALVEQGEQKFKSVSRHASR